MSPSVDPQALPGVAVHGMIPAIMRVETLSLENQHFRKCLLTGGGHSLDPREVKSCWK